MNAILDNENEQVIAAGPGLAAHLSRSDNETVQANYRLKEGCEFYPYDGAKDREEFIVRTPDKRQFKISALSKDILQRLDGTKSLEDLVCELEARSISISSDDLSNLLTQQYSRLNILESTDAQLNERNRQNQTAEVKLPFLLHWNLIPEKQVAWLAPRLKFLYHTVAVVAGLIFIALAHFLVYYQHPSFSHISNAGSLWVLILCLLSILCHEFGHAAAVSRYGGSPGHIGFGLYLLLPSFYADVSEIWRFRRKERMVVDLGGVYFQQLSFGVFAVLGHFFLAPEFFAVCYFIDLMAWFNLNPVFRFDGYWFLVDYLAIPNLYQHALKFIGYRIRKAFGYAAKEVVLPQMPWYTYWIFIIYALVCNLFVIAVVWFSYRYLTTMFVSLPKLLPEIFGSILTAFRTRDLALLLNRLVALFFAIALPGTALVGMYKYATFAIRYSQAKFLRRGSPSGLPTATHNAKSSSP
jgi:putative peptide zinc metalloprotease protein